ncbi:MAG: endonuclease III domain-containing protein [Candidatus Woesearchaeota archaeon]
MITINYNNYNEKCKLKESCLIMRRYSLTKKMPCAIISVIGEYKLNKKEIDIYNYLTSLFPEAKIELNFESDFQLLVAVILSAQCTDVRVNKVTKILFSKYPTPDVLSKAKISDIEKIIYSTGFYKNKAKNIVNLSIILMEKYGGRVPDKLNELVNCQV